MHSNVHACMYRTTKMDSIIMMIITLVRVVKQIITQDNGGKHLRLRWIQLRQGKNNDKCFVRSIHAHLYLALYMQELVSLVPRLPDFFNACEKRGGAWYLTSRAWRFRSKGDQLARVGGEHLISPWIRLPLRKRCLLSMDHQIWKLFHWSASCCMAHLTDISDRF